MAGRGPAPLPPDKRARKGVQAAVASSLRIIVAEPQAQPSLPDVEIEADGELVSWTWPARTREWWRMWRESPLSAEFTATDWNELLDTAFIHARFWRGDVKLASELRLRTALFGATPADRARLRVQFAQADEAEAKGAQRKSAGAGARERYAGLRAVAKDEPDTTDAPGTPEAPGADVG